MLHKRRIPLVWCARYGDMVMDPDATVYFCKGCWSKIRHKQPTMPLTAIANLPLFRECPLFFPDRQRLGKTLALRLARATIQQVYLSDKALKPGRHLSERARRVRQLGVHGNAVFHAHGSASQMLDKATGAWATGPRRARARAAPGRGAGREGGGGGVYGAAPRAPRRPCRGSQLGQPG